MKPIEFKRIMGAHMETGRWRADGWGIVITLFIDPVTPQLGVTRTYSAYNRHTGEQHPQRTSRDAAMHDMPKAIPL